MGIRSDLNPRVALDVVDEPIGVKCVIDHPLSVLGELVDFDLEEKDLAAASDDKRLLVDEVHVTKILVVDFLVIIIFFILILWVNLVRFCWYTIR